jgi:hypothetical protein
MRSRHAYTALAAAAFALAGCGGGGSGGYNGGGNSGSGVGAAPSPASAVTPFTPFVKAQLTQTSDATEPASVNEQEWTFDEDETAYDDVLL